MTAKTSKLQTKRSRNEMTGTNMQYSRSRWKCQDGLNDKSKKEGGKTSIILIRHKIFIERHQKRKNNKYIQTAQYNRKTGFGVLAHHPFNEKWLTPAAGSSECTDHLDFSSSRQSSQNRLAQHTSHHRQ